MTAPIIESRALSREFKGALAVAGLDLSIQPGELFGLVGPDGAGKTTTLRMLAGLLEVSAGSAVMAGIDLGSDAEAVKPKIGYMAQQFSLYGELTVSENLAFFAEIYRIDRKEYPARRDRLLAFAGLDEFSSRRAANLSGGMQKKLALACTLIHEPEILLLDEPTTGVDPISRREFWNILADLHLRGTTILVSTPYMDEADRCSRVGLMYGGKLVVCDTPQAIRGLVQGDLVEIRSVDWQEARTLVEALPGVLEVQTYGATLNVLVDSAKKRVPQIIRSFSRAHLAVDGVRQAPMRMEQAFISLIRRVETGED